MYKQLKIRETTLLKLKELQEKFGGVSYDQVINKLIEEHETLEKLLAIYAVKVALEMFDEVFTLLSKPEVSKALYPMLREKYGVKSWVLRVK